MHLPTRASDNLTVETSNLLKLGCIAVQVLFTMASTTPTVCKPPTVTNLILTLEVYEVNQADGAKLSEVNQDDDSRHSYVLHLLKNQKARLSQVLSCSVRAGEQCVTQQIDIITYAIVT